MHIAVFQRVLIAVLWIGTSTSTSILKGEEVVRVGTCADIGTLVEIRFNISDPLITLCHDEATDFTLWSKEIIHGKVLGPEEPSVKKSNFKEADFYNEINADKCYSTATQKNTVQNLLGSAKLAEKYIQGEPLKRYLSRGHLVPSGDQITPAEKEATYYFINASPQWASINGGNWEKLECKLRELAKKTLKDLEVWTGSYGILKLNNENNVGVEIWLGQDSQGNPVRKLPVNLLTWKVIHDFQTKTGVAIIQINNPWLEKVTSEHIICENICDKLDWIKWNTSDITRGYTYCCTVATFRQKVTYAPDLGNLPLFNPAGPSSDINGALVNKLGSSILLMIFTLHFLTTFSYAKL